MRMRLCSFAILIQASGVDAIMDAHYLSLRQILRISTHICRKTCAQPANQSVVESGMDGKGCSKDVGD